MGINREREEHLGIFAHLFGKLPNSMMDHPFHQHVNPAQVISITGGDTAYKNFYTASPAWKDTVIVPKEGQR